MSRILIALLLTTFVATAIWVTKQYGEDSILHPLILVNGVLAYFVLIPAAYLTLTGKFLFPLSNPYSSLYAGLSIFFLVYLLTIAGFRVFSTSSQDFKRYIPARRVPSSRDAKPQLVRWLGLAGFSVGLLTFSYYVWVNGGVMRMLTVHPRTAFSTVPETGRWRMIGLAGISGGFATLLVGYWPLLRHQTTDPRDMAILTIVTFLTFITSVMTRARMVIIIPVLVFLLYAYSAKLISRRAVLSAGGALAALVVVGSFVEAVFLGSGSTGIILRSIIHITRLEIFNGIVSRVPTNHPYQYGATLLRAFMIQWPDMPLRYGDQVELIIRGKNRANLTFSGMLLGELYLNFGLLGTLVGGFGYGAALGIVYRLRESTSYLAQGAYPILLIGTVLLLPTNLTWATQGIILRYLAPVAVAVSTAYILQQYTPVREYIGRQV
jgi:oligosaccharide repeat unit polymerase